MDFPVCCPHNLYYEDIRSPGDGGLTSITSLWSIAYGRSLNIIGAQTALLVCRFQYWRVNQSPEGKTSALAASQLTRNCLSQPAETKTCCPFTTTNATHLTGLSCVCKMDGCWVWRSNILT
jgi:hypothetical protein